MTSSAPQGRMQARQHLRLLPILKFVLETKGIALREGGLMERWLYRKGDSKWGIVKEESHMLHDDDDVYIIKLFLLGEAPASCLCYILKGELFFGFETNFGCYFSVVMKSTKELVEIIEFEGVHL